LSTENRFSLFGTGAAEVTRKSLLSEAGSSEQTLATFNFYSSKSGREHFSYRRLREAHP
jgi:hypothetical protein